MRCSVMNKKILVFLTLIMIMSMLLFPSYISAEDEEEDYIKDAEKRFEFLIFLKSQLAKDYVASLRTWIKDCRGKMGLFFKPDSMPFPTVNEYGVPREFTGFNKCFLGDASEEAVPSTMRDIAESWDAEVCLKFDVISRSLHSLKKGANLWEWTTALEEIGDNLDSIESSLKKIQSTVNQRLIELAALRKAGEKGLKEDYCFIATAAYGTPTSARIDVLRRFRDVYLQKSSLGKEFIKFYYKNSPPVARFISEHEMLRVIVREGFVEPVVIIVELTEFCWLRD